MSRQKPNVTSSRANDTQVGGAHYKGAPVEVWDLVNLLGLDYFQGQVLRYLLRWKDKAGVEDLHKARHYLDKYIEMAEFDGTPAEYAATEATRSIAARVKGGTK
jgi:Protein of unknwon function (DUF3310)